MKQKTLNIAGQLHDWWHEYWLMRWTVATMVGWSTGLLLASTGMRLMGFTGMFFAGALLGIGLSLPGAWILFSHDEMSLRRKWVLYSTAGGFFGIFPAGVLSLTGFLNIWIAGGLTGLMFGAIWGLFQSFVFVPLLGERAYLWIGVCSLAGGLSGLVMIPFLFTPIPLLLSPASLVFALITGLWLLRNMPDK